MESVDVAQLVILSGIWAVFVAGSIWLDKSLRRKVKPREHLWLAFAALSFVMFVVGGTVYATRFPESFLGWLYASAGVYGISGLIDIGLWIAVFVILSRNIFRKAK